MATKITVQQRTTKPTKNNHPGKLQKVAMAAPANLEKSDVIFNTLRITPPLSDNQKKINEFYENLTKRSNSKLISFLTASGLAKENPKSPLIGQYYRQMDCSKELTYDEAGNKITGKYCSCRGCQICNRIRMAQNIKNYLPQMEKLSDWHMVTLTVKNMPAEQIEVILLLMIAVVQQFMQNATQKKSKYSKEKLKLSGIRKLEFTYDDRQEATLYHPHFHILINSETTAHKLVEYWLKKFPTSVPVAQHVTPITTKEKALLEVFKYSVKAETKKSDTSIKFDALNTTNENEISLINYKALDVIYNAISGLRIFTAFGLTKPKTQTNEDEINPTQATAVPDEVQLQRSYKWNNSATNFVNEETGELLTNYEPSKKTIRYVKKANRLTTETDLHQLLQDKDNYQNFKHKKVKNGLAQNINQT